MSKFKSHWQTLIDNADAIIDRRTQSLIAWLEAPLFIDALEAFHSACDADGLHFEDTIGSVIFGVGSCKSCAAKLDEWVGEAKADLKTNLIWRAIALNQNKGAAEVNAALKIVYGLQTALTPAAFAHAVAQVKGTRSLTSAGSP